MSLYATARVEACVPHEAFEPREDAYQLCLEVTHARGWAAVTRDEPHSGGSRDLRAYEQTEAVHSHIGASFVLV